METLRAAASAQKMVADWAPAKWLASIAVMAVDYVLPTQVVKEAAIGAAVLIAFDTLTGTVVAWKAGRVTSKKFANVLVKMLAYSAVLSVAAITANVVPGLSEYASIGAMGILTMVVLTEGISVLENVTRLGVKIPFGVTEVLKKRLGEQDGS